MLEKSWFPAKQIHVFATETAYINTWPLKRMDFALQMDDRPTALRGSDLWSPEARLAVTALEVTTRGIFLESDYHSTVKVTIIVQLK